MTDHITLSASMAKALKALPEIASVTEAQPEGERNPRATFTVVGKDGSVCSVVVKRLMMGQAPSEPASKASKPKAKGR